MAKVTDFEGDSSSALGLSHSWSGHEAPSQATLENPLLDDFEWNTRFNEREAARLKAAGEPLPPSVTTFGSLEDRDLDDQIKAELVTVEKDRPDLNFPSQLNLARDRILAKQRQEPRNKGAYDIERGILSELAKEYPGLTLFERNRLARERAIYHSGEQPQLEQQDTQSIVKRDTLRGYMGASTESIMAHPHGSKGGGKSGRKNKTKKKGTWICGSCHLEYCIHRPKSVSRGPKPKEGVVRSKQKTVYVSPNTLEQLSKDGLTASDMLSVASIARRENRPLDEVVQEWR